MALAVIAVVLTLLGWVGLLAGAQAARGRAQTAADLGALAGAQGERVGRDGCPLAEETTRRNGAVLVACEVQTGGVVQVATSVRTVVGSATGAASAGPRPTEGTEGQDR